MLKTYGRGILFNWRLAGNIIRIDNEKGRIHRYHLDEVISILRWLSENFGSDWFPLANNVEKLGKGTEVDGLGVAILDLSPGDIAHAQGSSYLGVILDHWGIFEWNGRKRGIMWRIKKQPLSEDDLKEVLLSHLGD